MKFNYLLIFHLIIDFLNFYHVNRNLIYTIYMFIIFKIKDYNKDFFSKYFLINYY